MPVRDAGPYLEDCLRSILDQTYQDFEFVIRDDGSVDGSTEILRQWAARDPRIRLFVGERSLGPAESSNWVMRQTEATYVARMDADDIAHPDRLRRQLAVFDSCPDACLVGTLCEGIDARGRRVRPRDRWRLTRPGPFAPFPHGSIMVRRDAFERAGGYRRECDFWEDADLYFRLAEQGRLLVLPDSLYLHRASGLSTRLVSPPSEVERAVDNFYQTMGGRGEGLAVAADGKARLSPWVFVSLGSLRLWTGESPAMLGQIWRRGALKWDFESLSILVWALWGSISPRSLRRVLSSLISVRDFAVGHRFSDGQPWSWRPTLTLPVERTTGAADGMLSSHVEAKPAV
jgi:hypothetical protein